MRNLKHASCLKLTLGQLTTLALLCFSMAVSARAQSRGQSFAERLPDATSESLGALHEEFNIPRGDVDLDGVARFSDFLIISNYFGMTADVTYASGDINLDGTVDLADFAMHTFNFGEENFRPDPPSRPPNGNLGLSRNDDGLLTVSTANPVAVGAFEIVSELGGLTGGGDFGVPEPFIFYMSNTETRVTIAALTTELSPTLDGDYPTLHTSTTDDLEIRWIEPGSYDVYSLPFGGGDTLVGQITPGYAKPWEPPARANLENLDAAADLESLLLAHRDEDIARGELDGFAGVTNQDLVSLRRNWGQTVSKYSDGDLNLSGTVGLDDLAIFAANFGRSDWGEDSDRIVEEPAELSLSIDELGTLRLSGDRVVELGGIELTTTGNDGLLNSWRSTDPFEHFAGEDSDAHALVSSSTPVTLDGDVFLCSTRLVPNIEHEVTLRWFEAGSYAVFESGPFLLRYEADRSFGDVDGNRIVEFADFLLLSNAYGQVVEPSAGADITGDGRVNFHDFLILSFNFGFDTPRAAQVPEPAFGFRLVMALACALGCYRTRRNSQP